MPARPGRGSSATRHKDTGFSEFIPSGDGLIAWNTADEALEALLRVEKNHAFHSRKARELAVEHFEDRKVLQCLLDRCSGAS